MIIGKRFNQHQHFHVPALLQQTITWNNESRAGAIVSFCAIVHRKWLSSLVAICFQALALSTLPIALVSIKPIIDYCFMLSLESPSGVFVAGGGTDVSVTAFRLINMWPQPENFMHHSQQSESIRQ